MQKIDFNKRTLKITICEKGNKGILCHKPVKDFTLWEFMDYVNENFAGENEHFTYSWVIKKDTEPVEELPF